MLSNVGAMLRRRARRAKALFFKEGLVLLVRNFGLCPPQPSDISDWITRCRHAGQTDAAFRKGLSATPEAIPPPG
jgi:hypothetical protein